MTARAGPIGGPAFRSALRVGYAIALALALAWAALIVLASGTGGTLGFDYRAYDLAVDRLLAGQSMYDASAQATGGFGLFFYPPPFALLVLPVALLPTGVAVWTWTLLLIAASVLGIALLPVSARTRWIVLLLAALSWPLVYAIKLGQVGPLLLLLFAAAWRWLDRPWPFGIAAGIGTLIKLQPALLLGWAAVTGRRRAAVIGLAIVAGLSMVATIVAGPQSWLDEASLLGRVSRPIETPAAYGFGRLAFEAGVPAATALLIHWANLALVVVVVAFATWRASAVGSFLAVVIATQLVSPVLWDHYALVLLLPVAWLVDRGRWWAALIPLATSTIVLGLNPPVSYPIAFWAALLGVTWEGLRDARSGAGQAVTPAAATVPTTTGGA
jgi:hypothetical protein